MPRVNGLLDQLYTSSLKTDLGWMRAISDGDNVIRLDWNQNGWQELDHPDHVSRETTFQLRAFLSGQLHQFDLPLAPTGKSTTGRYWLDVMAKIPYGVVMSYAEFATLAGKPNAARAAGLSCSKNPIPIIYPCHRVIRTDGQLGYYSGCSNLHPAHFENLTRKSALLTIEANHIE